MDDRGGCHPRLGDDVCQYAGTAGGFSRRLRFWSGKFGLALSVVRMGTKRWRDYKGIWYTARQEMNHDDEIKHFHRFHGYDYSRGAAMMLSFHLEPRVPVFGGVNGNRMEYSDIGMIARKVLAKERDRTPDVQLKKSIIMPEHVHLRLYLRPGQKCPLERMGRFVYNFKAWTRNHAKKVGVEIGWQKNYHDWILPSREIISLADKYIENYRPKGDETRLFGDGRLLILSRVFAESTARGVGWHGINDAIGKIAKAAGGESVYVHWNSGEGVKWDFAK